MANSTVIQEYELTKDELAKVKVGTCPKCNRRLVLNMSIAANTIAKCVYSHELEKWVISRDNLNCTPTSLHCAARIMGCDAAYNPTIISKPLDE